MLDMMSIIGADDDEVARYGELYIQYKEMMKTNERQPMIVPEQVETLEVVSDKDEDFLRDVKSLKPEMATIDHSHIVDISKMSTGEG